MLGFFSFVILKMLIMFFDIKVFEMIWCMVCFLVLLFKVFLGLVLVSIVLIVWKKVSFLWCLLVLFKV